MESENTLKEGEDFYFENGLMVFTEKFHLKRGYCCGNGCRHCPYSNNSNDSNHSNGSNDSKNLNSSFTN
ncbi:MAG TPA: hypothetical protein DGG95_17520 [Cytophagales bacterium]|jgi:hypothetical protein|nr:hypothetical protein [Cytophagales bacterium]